MNPRMKVGSIIGEPLRVHGMAGDKAQYHARIASLMKTVGLRIWRSVIRMNSLVANVSAFVLPER